MFALESYDNYSSDNETSSSVDGEPNSFYPVSALSSTFKTKIFKRNTAVSDKTIGLHDSESSEFQGPAGPHDTESSVDKKHVGPHDTESSMYQGPVSHQTESSLFWTEHVAPEEESTMAIALRNIKASVMRMKSTKKSPSLTDSHFTASGHSFGETTSSILNVYFVNQNDPEKLTWFKRIKRRLSTYIHKKRRKLSSGKIL